MKQRKDDGHWGPERVHGMYQNRVRPLQTKSENYMDGFSTKPSLDKWSEWASANSGPKIAPGDGDAAKQPNEVGRTRSRRLGWAE
jgi:hypothetical protein